MYFCQICDYETEFKNQINEHHIQPKELAGGNQKYNKVHLCPNCHNKVYVPGAKSGAHAIERPDSIIIKGWFLSTEGRVLHYIKNGLEQYVKEKGNEF